jgi:hypothetical protein
MAPKKKPGSLSNLKLHLLHLSYIVGILNSNRFPFELKIFDFLQLGHSPLKIDKISITMEN